jgi:predicted nucleic acid-binding Zn ribbon protein
MTYSYNCQNCNYYWDESLPMDSRDLPLNAPCPQCTHAGSIKRVLAAPGISYAGGKTILQRAGSGWNDVLNKVKKASGRNANIETR